MASFVLVHGGWSGAHGFRHLRKILQVAGHDVSTPSLTGVGERIHLGGPLVNLSTHVRDVVNHVLYEDLDAIVLMGFSYGGLVVTGALEHIAERVRHLVYLDAFVPGQGDTWGGLTGRTMTGRPKIGLGEESLLKGPAREYDDPGEAAWMTARRTTHPMGCLNEPVHLSQPLERFPFTRTYIKASGASRSDPSEPVFRETARRAQESPAWRYFEIPTNHMVASNRPRELAELLQRIADPD